jgi:sugar phosphate isomerase/epimerase
MASSIFSLARLGLLALAGALAFAPVSRAADKPAAGPDGMELGLQCWTFRSLTFLETLDRAANLGVKNIQIYAGQTIGGGLTGVIGPDLTPEQRKTIKGWVKDRGLALVSIGVTGAGDEAGWKKLVDFARDMGLHTIATEPEQEMLPMIDKVVKGTGIRIALHDHPAPSRYADPAVALAAVKPFGPHFGLCADTGHWTRDARDPVACLRQAEGRIIELHLKDISESIKSAHDMPWGTGIGNAAGQIAELRRQGFKGYVFIEYEHNTAALEADVARCIAYFRAAMRAPLADLIAGKVMPPGYTQEIGNLWRDRWASSGGKWPSPQPLLKPDLSNAEFAEGSWAWEGDVLVAKGGGDLWTKESYGDFALSLEFKVEAGGNSGVFLRTSDTVNWLHNAIEVQILQGDADNPRHVVGSIFDVLAPGRQKPIEPGTWHQYVIIADGSKIIVHLDGEKVIEADLNLWTTAGKNPDDTPNKFAKAYRDMAREGRIGLQYHGNPVSFRNILIEKL